LNGAVTGVQLPAMIDNIYWNQFPDTLIGDVLTPPGLSLTLIGTGDLKFQTRRIQVCPQLEFVEIRGTWGSATGAKAVLTGLSTCSPGKCILRTTSTKITLNSVYLTLTDEVQELIVFFQSNAKEVHFDLICTSLGIDEEVTVIGELDDPNPITPVPDNIQPDGFNQWFDDLSTVAKVFFIIGMVVAGLIMVGLLMLFIWFLPSMILWCKMMKNKRDYQNLLNKKSDDEEVELSEDVSEEKQSRIDEKEIDKTDQPDEAEQAEMKKKAMNQARIRATHANWMKNAAKKV
jgi:hypothetical protein